MTKFLNVLIGGLLTFTFLITSCSEDSSVLGLSDTENFVDPTLDLDFAAERGGEKCLELVYPITIVFPDETTLEVADAAERKAALSEWIAANDRGAGKPGLVYPVDVITSDDETITVADADEMKALLKECPRSGRGGKGTRGGRNGKGPKGGIAACLDLVYPLTIVFPDETTVEVADKQAQRDTIKGWIKANGKDAGRPAFQYPVDVISGDETVTAANADELKELAKACRGDRKMKCFSLVYPLTITFPDDTTAEVADRSEMRASFKAWKEANPDSDERPELTFPLSIELEDGTIQEVASKEDLEAQKESCKG